MKIMRARRRPPPVRRAWSGLLVVATLSVTTILGFAASNSVPASKAADRTSTVTAENLKPAACNAITLTAVVTGSGIFAGGAANELILGSAGIDSISGNGGNDCIVAGGGNDTLNGGSGTDVCIGGPGINTFNSNCETKI